MKMQFIFNSEWQILFALSIVCLIIMIIREIYRFRSMLKTYGKIIAFITTLIVYCLLACQILIIFKIGIIPFITSFLVLIIIASIFGILLNERKKSFIHPENTAQAEYERRMIPKLIDYMLSINNNKQLLITYNKDRQFLIDIFNRCFNLGHPATIKRVKNPLFLKHLLSIDQREGWTEEDKIIELCLLFKKGVQD